MFLYYYMKMTGLCWEKNAFICRIVDGIIRLDVPGILKPQLHYLLLLLLTCAPPPFDDRPISMDNS